MKHDTFARWLKIVIICMAMIGIALCIYIVPEMARIYGDKYPEFSGWIIPWKVIIYICAVPCFAALVLCWMIASNIEKDNSFCRSNAKMFKIFSYLALGDSIFFILACIVMWLIGMNHPGLLLVDFFICFIGLAIFVCTSALSYFVGKAASLQEENDLTI